jgi:hypothetical protein
MSSTLFHYLVLRTTNVLMLQTGVHGYFRWVCWCADVGRVSNYRHEPFCYSKTELLNGVY